jgi:hypothetical protein
MADRYFCRKDSCPHALAGKPFPITGKIPFTCPLLATEEAWTDHECRSALILLPRSKKLLVFLSVILGLELITYGVLESTRPRPVISPPAPVRRDPTADARLMADYAWRVVVEMKNLKNSDKLLRDMKEVESKEALRDVRNEAQHRLELARERCVQGFDQLTVADRTQVANAFAKHGADQAGRGFAREAEATRLAAQHFQSRGSGGAAEIEELFQALDHFADELFKADQRALNQ